MKKNIISFCITLFLFLIIDTVWILMLAQNFYDTHIGFLFKEPNIHAALLFYVIYTLTINFFVIHPATKAQSIRAGAARGALFGLACYATYDLTNFATIDGWPLIVTVVDIIWGTILTSAVGALGTLIHIRLEQKRPSPK